MLARQRGDRIGFAPRLAFRFVPKINSAAINLGMPLSLTIRS